MRNLSPLSSIHKNNRIEKQAKSYKNNMKKNISLKAISIFYFFCEPVSIKLNYETNVRLINPTKEIPVFYFC